MQLSINSTKDNPLQILITNDDVLKVDRASIHLIYEKWPDHFRDAAKISPKLDHGPEFYRSLVLCGMGGSGTSCDILQQVMSDNCNVPSVVVKGGDIPRFVNKRSLVIINSVSGNTAETVHMMKVAANRRAEVICISAGGKLKDAAIKEGLSHIDIPNLSVPRASLPYLLLPGLKLINPLLSKPVRGATSMNQSLAKIARKISISVPHEINVAKQIAQFLEGGLAFCFTSPQLISAGTRFKNSLNENAKLHCLRETVMEASHNEIVPFTFDNNYNSRVLLLRWLKDSEAVNDRFQKVRSLFSDIRQPFMEIAVEGALLNAIVSSIYILDYSSIYMAVARKIDPAPTPAIDILKSI